MCNDLHVLNVHKVTRLGEGERNNLQRGETRIHHTHVCNLVFPENVPYRTPVEHSLALF